MGDEGIHPLSGILTQMRELRRRSTPSSGGSRLRPAYQVFDIKQGDAGRVVRTPYGSVGTLYEGEGIEAVYVRKKGEQIDPSWFSQNAVDLILVVQGKLKIEFEGSAETRILRPGQLLVLPAEIRCRAYRWPRTARQPTVFFAVYPTSSNRRTRHR